MDLERYASTRFGKARKTHGRPRVRCLLPVADPRTLELPGPTIRLLADAEAALGTLSGVGRLVPNPIC